MNTFQQENDKMLQFLLNERFFKNWQDFSDDLKDLNTASQVEFYITNQCNQHCEYCYLHDNYNIYPAPATKPKMILANLKLVYNWFIKKQFHIQKIDFFSGEIWHTQLGFDILDLTYLAIQRGLHIQSIMIPTNGSFVLYDSTRQKIQNYINNFRNFGVNLSMSFSIDGKIIDELDRPRNDNSKLYTDEFYSKLFDFAYYNNFYFHPMVAAITIEKWVENFQWWKTMCHHYNWSPHKTVMMLEVRNSDWTTEKIKTYCKFLTYLLDDFLLENPQYNSAEAFGNFLFGFERDEVFSSYLPWNMALVPDIYSCTIPTQLCIRLGDLALAPCHRTAYDKFLYGYLVEENGAISSIKESNMYLAEYFLFANNSVGTPKCDMCPYASVCLKGCAGSQYENTGDPLFPVSCVCALEQAKIDTLIEYYNKKGILKYFESLSIEHPLYSDAQKLLGVIYEIQKSKTCKSYAN